MGYDDGTGEHYYQHEYSRTPDILRITEKSNVGFPRRWAFNLSDTISKLLRLASILNQACQLSRIESESHSFTPFYNFSQASHLFSPTL